MKKQAKGFTLLELMVVIAIIGILAAIAGPSYARMMAKTRLNTLVGEWRSAFYLAQKEAIRTKKEVRLCPSTDGATCDNGKTNYQDGWIILTHDDKVVRDYPPISDNKLKLRIANGVELKFSSSGRLPNNASGATLVACNDKYKDDKGMMVAISISRSGRIEPADDSKKTCD